MPVAHVRVFLDGNRGFITEFNESSKQYWALVDAGDSVAAGVVDLVVTDPFVEQGGVIERMDVLVQCGEAEEIPNKEQLATSERWSFRCWEKYLFWGCLCTLSFFPLLLRMNDMLAGVACALFGVSSFVYNM
jgi:hypothetical protein